jgi:hypothetical protein
MQTQTESRRGEVPTYAPEWAPGLPGKWTYAVLDPVSELSPMNPIPPALPHDQRVAVR